MIKRITKYLRLSDNCCSKDINNYLSDLTLLRQNCMSRDGKIQPIQLKNNHAVCIFATRVTHILAVVYINYLLFR